MNLFTKARRRPSQVFREAVIRPPVYCRSRFGDRALIAVFLLLISLPLSGLILGFDRSFVLEENRTLATRPELKLDRAGLKSFPARFEAYFNDRFCFRKRLIRWLALVKVKGLRVTSTPGVIMGRDGWLFLASDAALASYRATRPFTPDQLEKYGQILESRRGWLASRGVPYLVVILPNKDTIYPEFMPGAYTKVHPGSRLDQLLDHMKSHSNVPILDVRADLRRAKQSGRVYHVTDSHWNLRGGYIAYGRIMQALSAWLPRFQVMARSEFREVAEAGPGGDLAMMLGLADQLPEERLNLDPRAGWHFHHTGELYPIAGRCAHPELTVVTERGDAKLPRAVLFRDSFAAQLIPFLAEHFQRMVCIWDSNFDRAIIEHERPTVVIQEIVERSLEGPLPKDR